VRPRRIAGPHNAPSRAGPLRAVGLRAALANDPGPELVAERITRYADRLGTENVIAGTDCGFGSRIHPELGWAKLSALAEGAALASSRIWKA
jgi:hypothetical protein